ncbi:MAG: hypothetical protein ACK4MF_07625 [Hyphomicrobiaceae bacterium]
MQPRTDDIRRTLEYGYSHDQAQKMMPFALGAVALGLVMLVPLDGAERSKNVALGLLVVAAALVVVGVVVWRRLQPNEAYIVVSERGVLFKLVSDRIIPWDEIRAVDRDLVSAPRDFLATKVVRLTVSERFFENLKRGKIFYSTTARDGDPAHIYLAYDLKVPHDELYSAICRRWRAYSRHALGGGASEDEPAGWQIGDAAATTHPRRIEASGRVRSFEGTRAFLRLLIGGGAGVVIANLAALAAIVALVTNLLGYWSTNAQIRGRQEAAEWKSWKEKHDERQRALDAEIERSRAKFDLMFKCMNEDFDRSPGAYRSPECQREK